MTAYTSSNADFVYIKQEGEFREYIVHLDRLNTADTLDLTPWVNGGKACFVEAEDHAATITNGEDAAGVTTSGVNSRFKTSMVVSSDVVTFTGGGDSFDAHVNFKVVPPR